VTGPDFASAVKKETIYDWLASTSALTQERLEINPDVGGCRQFVNGRRVNFQGM
jgi:hypothetical protein